MWSVIPVDKYDDFIHQYSELEPFASNLILHHSKRHNLYILPRLFYKNYPHPFLKVWSSKDTTLRPLYDPSKPIEFKLKLKQSQHEIVQRLDHIYNINGHINGIIHARPGTGKTILSIYLAIKYNKRPLFVVDNTKLKNQWIKEILFCTNATEDQIGIIQGSKLEINTSKPFTIAMVQTLMSKAKSDPLGYFKKFCKGGYDFVVYDECHKTTAGEQYSKASLFLNTENVLGLSATPFPSSLQEILLYNTIGPVIVRHGKYDLVPKVVFVKYKSGLKQYIDKKAYKTLCYMLYSNRTFGVSKYNSHIIESPIYLKLIYQLVKILLQNKHRIIIIVSTIKQVDAISNTLTNYGIENVKFYSKQQKIDQENDKVLVATYKFASHGFDYDALSSAILALPLFGKTSLIQCIGRILRSSDKPKPSPIVFDLVDLDFRELSSPSILKIKENILRKEFKDCKFERLAFDDIPV